MRTRKVLLVEDDRWLGELYRDALMGLKHTTLITAGSAEEALQKLDEHSVDLIVLDMFLPGHNGIELLHEIASYEDTATLPVLILSAVEPGDFGLKKERWSHYGIVEYLYKPITKPREVAEKVEYYLTHFAAAKVG